MVINFDLDKVLNTVANIILGAYRVFFFPVVLAHKMADGGLKLKKAEITVDAKLKFKDSQSIENPEKEEIEFGQIDALSRKNVRLFVNRLIENFSPDCLINLQRNLKNTKINTEFFYNLYHGIDSSGHFKAREDGKINRVEVDSRPVLFHELFHVATHRRISDSLEFDGFEQEEKREDGKWHSLGSALNEGYTELMTDRYFKKEKLKGLSYEYQVSVVRKIEQVIGRDKMEQLYLTSNPKGLFDALTMYISEVEAKILFFNNDRLLLNKPSKKNAMSEEDVKKTLEEIDRILVNLFVTKETRRLNNQEISEDEYRENITDFTQSFAKEVELNGHKYQVSNKACEETMAVLNNPMFRHVR